MDETLPRVRNVTVEGMESQCKLLKPGDAPALLVVLPSDQTGAVGQMQTAAKRTLNGEANTAKLFRTQDPNVIEAYEGLAGGGTILFVQGKDPIISPGLPTSPSQWDSVLAQLKKG